jgi:hypothetical protein
MTNGTADSERTDKVTLGWGVPRIDEILKLFPGGPAFTVRQAVPYHFKVGV